MGSLQRELKFVFPNDRAGVLRDWLGLRCAVDPAFPAGRIAGIYYDTADGRYLGEKVNSDYLKTKIRLRWYGDWATGKPFGRVYLEVKQRIGSTRQKARRVLEWSAEELDGARGGDPRFAAVSGWVAEMGFRAPPDLAPMISLEYRRSRYVEPETGTRICLDQDIAPIWILGKGSMQRTPIAEGVFEVKGTVDRLPVSLLPMVEMGCRLQSFSKYERCMARAMPGEAAGGT